MTPQKHADEEVAATDAVFEQLAEQPEVLADPGTDPAAPAAPVVSVDTSVGPPTETEAPPVGDYLRELRAEFDQQEEDSTL